jgi:hypothetical protein
MLDVLHLSEGLRTDEETAERCTEQNQSDQEVSTPRQCRLLFHKSIEIRKMKILKYSYLTR